LPAARHLGHKSVLRAQSIRHTHADDGALLVVVRALRGEKNGESEHKNAE
jgi:hypothetical protein